MGKKDMHGEERRPDVDLAFERSSLARGNQIAAAAVSGGGDQEIVLGAGSDPA